jgi:hypothetical protein
MQKVSIGSIIYFIIGIIVASNRGYLTDINSISHILSAILAIILWPILFLGANLHIAL